MMGGEGEPFTVSSCSNTYIFTVHNLNPLLTSQSKDVLSRVVPGGTYLY